jgi:hypothetical protein
MLEFAYPNQQISLQSHARAKPSRFNETFQVAILTVIHSVSIQTPIFDLLGGTTKNG